MYLTSPPAWSFAKKYASKIESNAPGPGAYSPKGANLEKSPNYKIGTSSRDARRSSNSPGPGAYNPSKSEHSPAPKMGFSQREPLSDSLANPGPGTYQVPPKFQEGPKYSISGKHSTRLIGEVPGPGHYSQDLNAFTMKERPPSARIGTSQREDFTQNGRNAPGPGAYEVLRPQSAGPKWGFGNDARDKLFKSEAPGPGTYEMGNTLDRKAWSISGKHPEIGDKTSIPGPGAYDPKLFKADLPAYSVGRSSRSDFTKGFEKSPGPGTYENKGLRPSSSAPKLGTSKRPPLSQTEDIPGPGAYEFRSTNDGPQYSIPGRDAKQQRPKTPGPGHYNPDGSVTERAPQ